MMVLAHVTSFTWLETSVTTRYAIEKELTFIIMKLGKNMLRYKFNSELEWVKYGDGIHWLKYQIYKR